MTVAWTAHRFSGGNLALDTANTVVLRLDPARRFDRFDDPREIGRFAEAASVFRRAEIGRPLKTDGSDRSVRKVKALRESTDALMRGPAAGGSFDDRAMSRLLRDCAAAVDGCDELRASADTPFGPPGEPIAFEAALAVSALSLLQPANLKRLKICPNCAWLFLDKSRNSSRLWCDMSVCGNRAKARQHYRRHSRQGETSNG